MNNEKKVIKLLKESPRGLTILEIANILKLNRHTVKKILENLLIEKVVDYEEKGPAKIFFYVGEVENIAKIEIGKDKFITVDKIKSFEKEFIRISEMKKDSLIRKEEKFKNIGSIALEKEKLKELIEILKKLI
jgi:predicted ArsR family transcriptional regulator